MRPHEMRNRIIAGIVLIGIGLFILAGQVFDLGGTEWLILPGLGLIFLAWGLGTRTFGLLIPGGILGGIGLGVFLIERSSIILSEEATGGLFLLAFAAGWILISILSPLTEARFQWWPLIPGGILGFIGLALVQGGAALTLLQWLNYAWPAALIIFGGYLILRRRT